MEENNSTPVVSCQADEYAFIDEDITKAFKGTNSFTGTATIAQLARNVKELSSRIDGLFKAEGEFKQTVRVYGQIESIKAEIEAAKLSNEKTRSDGSTGFKYMPEWFEEKADKLRYISHYL